MVATGLRSVLWFVCTFLLCVSINVAHATSITLTGPSGTVSEGYFQLEYQLESVNSEGSSVNTIVFERAASESFDVVEDRYPPLGSFSQVTLSGFSNGTYYFRARDTQSGETSNIVSVTVQHYPLSRALTLFGLGALIFIALVVFILHAHSRSSDQSVSKGSV
ncbi:MULTISPECIES: hypothetical protein [Gammaproteobacteria]|uniref:hypothetical protein n=1 Tax=Gammaproteobacteria TaxID=1236 RepID=UPI000DCFA11C|nr:MULTISPECIES: hypothetical protein [Gammaproteobacteria]RTE86933.1 hypothetical protein DQX04_00660 [Aliidiomarina sp. B3213]TCZ93277.1 hypothetical protein EYQ95_04640 [Lysobacter sp. N42]